MRDDHVTDARTAGLAGRPHHSGSQGCAPGCPVLNQPDPALAARPQVARSTRSLFEKLEAAEGDIEDLLAAWDGLPDAYQRGSNLWDIYDELERALDDVSRARRSLMGDR